MSEVKDFSGFKYVFKCANCGGEFGANRINNVFCSGKCGFSQWRRDNPEKAREQGARNKKKNRERNRENTARWRRENPERNKEIDHAAKANEKAKKSLAMSIDAIMAIKSGEM